ncbi:MAG: FAD-dependent oxidoreductase, partial [Bdellovibrionales bacterium]|nr:FAD-dependent oxidoreductase [Bdellovibrionales bacterium]
EKIPYPDIPITDPELVPYIAQLDRLSFHAHLESIVGEPLHEQIETAIEQYCWSSLGASSKEVSAAAGVNFYAAEFGGIAVLPGGNSRIAERVFERLAQSLPVQNLRSGSLVFDVSVGKDGVRVAYLEGSGAIRSILAKCVVMACPKFVAAKLINGLEPERLESIKQLTYRSYLVANVCIEGGYDDPFYDLYMLGKGTIEKGDTRTAANARGVTDVIIGNYAKADSNNTVLTLYRGLPYDGARAELYLPGSYKTYRAQFEEQITKEILPLLKIEKGRVKDIRLARWGHPLVVPKPGLISSKNIANIRKPFKDRVFFVEQDNWALPAFETSVTEALLWAPKIAARLA